MIFERITLHNFQRYHGTSSIEFPETGDSKSIVLILAPNNSGKTTVLRALRFLFYGSLSDYTRETAWNLANARARHAVEVGESIEVWVEARLSIADKKPVTLRREFRVRQSSQNRWVTEGPYLLHKKTDLAKEEFQPDGDGSVQSQIDAAVPEDLFSWFYFAGEPASGRMSHGNSRTLIEPLKKAIQIRRWGDAINTARSTVESLRRQLAKDTKNSGAYADLLHKRDVVSKSKVKREEELIAVHRELQVLESEFKDLDAECLRTSKKAEESQDLYRRLKDQERKLDRAESALEQASATICALVSKSTGLPLLEPALPEIEKRLEALRKANLLPADISKGFIERLLEASQCVCGRPHDDAAREHLANYLKQTLASQTNNDLVNLANAMEGGEESRICTAITSYPGLLRKATGQKADAIKAISEAQSAIDDLGPKVQSSSIEEFNKLVRARDEVGRRIRSRKDTEAELTNGVKRQEATLKDLQAQLSKARPKRGADKIEKLESAIEIAERLVSNLRAGQERFQNSVYELLQSRLSTHFDTAVTGDNRAKLDRETLLPMIQDSAGHIVKNPGGGEMQVLSIAFVAALAELRSQINQDLKDAGLAGRLLGEQSFVLDSPFTSADHNYMRAIADFLPNKAPQLLILLAKQNWPDTVREALEPHVASAYGITLHTSTSPKDPTSFEFPLNGHTVCLREELKAGEDSYTTFSKI